MNYEAWIWTELLAFDNVLPDQGVDAYLSRLGFVPRGVSLLASASDFVMLHGSMREETVLFPDVCARFGHAGNEERERQEWTNFQVRSLVANLRARGVEVFVSVFAAYHRDRFHREWLTDHPEARIVYADLGVTDGLQVLARLDDGSLYGDLFAGRLACVIRDYGFDGWHGPDCFGPGGPLHTSDCSDSMMARFAEYLGDRCPPELRSPTGHKVPLLKRRMDLVWDSFRPEWTEFNMRCWEGFWEAIVRALRPTGAKTMINSGGTKAAFESMYAGGIDYRRIAALGVDYLVVETVAGNLALINGGRERHFEFAATLAEMKAAAPGMKMLFLHGVKDVVESYDLLRHAPARLEREVFTLANQFVVGASGGPERCAAGFMVCLGDGLAAAEWRYLRRQWETGFSFQPVRAGELTWLWGETAIDGLMEEYPVRGTWPGFKQVARLVGKDGLQIQTICRAEDLARASGPLVVPNADLLPDGLLRELRRYAGGPAVLIGRAAARGPDDPPAAVSCRVSEDYVLECTVLNGPVFSPADVAPAPGPGFRGGRPSDTLWDEPEYMAVPEEFWERTAAVLRATVNAWEDGRGAAGCRAEDTRDGLRVMTFEDAAGVLRTALVSCLPTYLKPRFRFTRRLASVEKAGGFPYTPLVPAGDSVRSGHNLSPLHIPPFGVIVMDAVLEPRSPVPPVMP